MPRLTHSVPKYSRHKASGQAVVTLDGIDFYLGPYGSKASKREYERLVGEWLACGRRLPPKSAANGLTVVELAAAYLSYAKGYYRKDGKPTSTLLRVKAALRVLRDTYGDTAVVDFGPLALQAIQQRLVSQGKSRRYVNYLIEEIKRVFKWGGRQEIVPASVWHGLLAVTGLKKGRSDAREPAPVTPVADATVNATLPYLTPVVADMVRFQRLTGCRPGEVCLVRPADVDTSGDVWRFVPAHHKTEHHGKRRVIWIGPKAQAILRPYLLRPADAYCFSPQDSLKKHLEQREAERATPAGQGNAVGTNRKRKPKRTPGERFTSGSYARAITRACELAFGMPKELREIAAKLPPETRAQRLAEARAWRAENCWSPNQLRHSLASEVRSKFTAESAQVVLGHSNLRVTEIYAERDEAKAADIMRQVG